MIVIDAGVIGGGFPVREFPEQGQVRADLERGAYGVAQGFQDFSAGGRIVVGERAGVVVNAVGCVRGQAKAATQAQFEFHAVTVAGIIVITQVSVCAFGVYVVDAEP